MKPHVMATIVSDVGQVVESYTPSVWRQATSPATASAVKKLMVGVTTFGTAENVFSPSLVVAAKTETAETGLAGCSADWLIAGAPAGNREIPKVSVAAVLPDQPGLSCSDTGAAAAGPRVAEVLEAALAEGR
jgi:penicillin-binding protein A